MLGKHSKSLSRTSQQDCGLSMICWTLSIKAKIAWRCWRWKPPEDVGNGRRSLPNQWILSDLLGLLRPIKEKQLELEADLYFTISSVPVWGFWKEKKIYHGAELFKCSSKEKWKLNGSTPSYLFHRHSLWSTLQDDGLGLCDADHQEIKEILSKNIHEKEIHLLDMSYLKRWWCLYFRQ